VARVPIAREGASPDLAFHFGNRFVEHVHSSLTGNPAVCKSAIRVWRAMAPFDFAQGRSAPPCPHMSTKTSPLEKYRYRRRLPHLQKADADLFITFCTGGRRILPEQARDLVMEHSLREGGLQALAGEGARPHTSFPTPVPRIRLHAVVVMPDHVHLLLTPLRDGAMRMAGPSHSWTFCNASRAPPLIALTG